MPFHPPEFDELPFQLPDEGKCGPTSVWTFRIPAPVRAQDPDTGPSLATGYGTKFLPKPTAPRHPQAAPAQVWMAPGPSSAALAGSRSAHLLRPICPKLSKQHFPTYKCLRGRVQPAAAGARPGSYGKTFGTQRRG